jgi:hypothetical protein
MYILGDLTLPRPKALRRETIEKAVYHETLNGTLKKDVQNRKERFILEFRFLTQDQVNQILAEYNLETSRNFQSTETNLVIAATPVHIEIEGREYNTPGNEYREDITLILTEVV